ncbi:MAG: HupE/UreJ family protein [Planctomycetota bacterium]
MNILAPLLLAPLVAAPLATPAPAPASAPAPAPHAFNQSYIYLRIDEEKIEGKLEINLSDLNRAIGTEFRTDLTVTEEEVAAQIEPIEAYLYGNVSFAIGGETVELERQGHEMYQSAKSQYVSCRFLMLGVEGVPDEIEVTHDLVFDVDPQHRGFLVIEHFFDQGTFMNEGMISLTFSPGDTTQTLDLTDRSVWRGIQGLIKLGVHHILIGIDHILFLLVLLLPSVLRRKGNAWEPRESFKSSLWEVLKIVTVFTITHSITLSLASLGILTLPSRLVESVIALSIAIAAVDIVYPVFRGRILAVVAVFGLFHGFGFANVLGEMGISGVDMALSLLGFNVGVEIGQVMIVCAVFPFLFMMRLSKLYTQFSVYAGAGLAIFVSLYWFIERAFEVNLTLGETLGPIINFF